ncbi:methionyl-tRNA formyltransferase [Mycetocola spongiae]|uniref:methionyl-tRNA formyltransferase n=1 Tax=Mycetocola spongiae TaxID=2859226 RepID=UPI001CF4678F|nr:methionyl-tRNA formyltransferase [Mycetocola spongiae]UCR89599.1 methionyl-tRNA formyltransferase [Mycetocola spongiae]
MKIIFAGTPEVALPSLEALLGGDHDVIRVLSRPDAPLGRKRVLTPSPVAALAQERGIPVSKATRLDGEVARELAELDADLGVVVAYGGLIREPLLSAPRLGWINLHFSLLPAWRGAAPVQHSLIHGDTVTGADVFQLVAALDAGEILGELTHQIHPDATAGDLLAELAVSGAELLARVVDELAAGTARPRPQEGEPTLAGKLGLEDGALHFGLPGREVYNRFRGVTPEPGAHTLVDGVRMKILEARLHPEVSLEPGAIRFLNKKVLVGCAEGALELIRVQPSGRPGMNAGDWWRGLGTNPEPEAQR